MSFITSQTCMKIIRVRYLNKQNKKWFSFLSNPRTNSLFLCCVWPVHRRVSFVLMKPLRLFFAFSDWSVWSQEVCWNRSWWKGSTRFDQSQLDFCLRVAVLKGQTETPPPFSISNFSGFIHFAKRRQEFNFESVFIMPLQAELNY